MEHTLQARFSFWKSHIEVLEPRLPLSGDPLIFDPHEVGWAAVYNLTDDQFVNDFNAHQGENILIDIEVDEGDGQQLLSGVWQKNMDGRLWTTHHNMTNSQFENKWTEYRNTGYRLIDQESYVWSGQRYYAGIWINNVEESEWHSGHHLTSTAFSDQVDQYKQDYLPIDFEAYAVGDSIRYANIWVENKEEIQWTQRRDLTSTEFSKYLQRYKNLYRVHDVESYLVGGEQRYAAIWVENRNDRGWEKVYDMDVQEYDNHRLHYQDLGYRLIDFERYETAVGTRYAAAWRQNTDRPDWYLRSSIDSIAQSHFEDHNIPGMSVAIVYEGTIKYMRGFGNQNVANDVWYSAQTINRLASVSKAIAGVLLLELADQGEINPSAATSSYVSQLPNHHTHTLEQLASNRAGVGHYSELGLGTLYTEYDTALEAAKLFWDEALVSVPGTSYRYSTHGYTLLGAGIEGAIGQPIDEVFYNALGSELDLPTLKLEDRSVANEFRTTLYNTNNTEATSDNISWKLLGGGMEASAYDLVRFSAMLMEGQILSEESLEKLWTVPDPSNVSYAMGWTVGKQQGAFSIRKDGSQLGANTYLRLFPELELGIVVLSNRRNSEPGDLSSDIANEILSIMPKMHGDFNSDNHVDAADFTVFRDTLGSTTDLRADADVNGVIGLEDYQLWRNYFGTSPMLTALSKADRSVDLQAGLDVDNDWKETSKSEQERLVFHRSNFDHFTLETDSAVDRDIDSPVAEDVETDLSRLVDTLFAQSFRETTAGNDDVLIVGEQANRIRKVGGPAYFKEEILVNDKSLAGDD